MPPIDYSEYPKNWKTEIRPAVMKRAGEVKDDNGIIIQEAKCEGCGVLNHAKGARNFKGEWMTELQINNLNSDSGEFNFQHLNGAFPSITTIVLTIAHLDHDKGNDDVSIDRLRAWCQRCHLNYDRPRHVQNRKNNLKKKKGIIEMFDIPEDVEASGAKFNEEQTHRFFLYRIWDDRKPLAMFIGLNPSTAAEDDDDPTIQSVRRICKHNNLGGFYMLNCFTFITPKPLELKKNLGVALLDADYWLEEISLKCQVIVFAWGAFPEVKERAEEVNRKFTSHKVLCIGRNDNGSPKHPLFQKGNSTLIKF